MTDLPHSKPSSIAHGEKEHEMVGGFTRRKVLAGAAAATAAMSVGAVDGSAGAQTRQDMVAFVLLSSALTGLAEGRLRQGSDWRKWGPGPIRLMSSKSISIG